MDVIPASVYEAIDWTRCAIGGSYALQQYTAATTWQPHDIDLACACNTHKEFVTLRDTLLARLGGTELSAGAEEEFHETIVATSTMAVPGLALPLQLVGITTKRTPSLPEEPLHERLARIADLPACVTYTNHGRLRIFHVPDWGREAVHKRVIQGYPTSASRKEKYMARGFKFYE